MFKNYKNEISKDKQTVMYTVAKNTKTISFAMISSPRAMKNVSLYGIEPDKEILVSNINKQIIDCYHKQKQ